MQRNIAIDWTSVNSPYPEGPRILPARILKIKENIIEIINILERKIKKDLIPRLLSNISFLRSNKYKYIKFYNGIEEFYDLSIDPFEQVNLINENNKSESPSVWK